MCIRDRQLSSSASSNREREVGARSRSLSDLRPGCAPAQIDRSENGQHKEQDQQHEGEVVDASSGTGLDAVINRLTDLRAVRANRRAHAYAGTRSAGTRGGGESHKKDTGRQSARDDESPDQFVADRPDPRRPEPVSY